MPVFVGAAAAYAVSHTAMLGRLAGYTAAACLVIAWLNLSNDAYDAETGVDQHGLGKAESVVNMTGQCVAGPLLGWGRVTK